MPEVRIKMSTDGAAAVSSDFRAVAAEVNKLGDRIDKSFKPQLTATEAAFRTLGLEGSRAFKELQNAAQSDRIKAAFDTIQKSSWATAAEVDRAAQAMNQQLAMVGAGAAPVERAFGGLGNSARRAFEVFTGVSAANAIGMLKSLADEGYRAGLQALQAERAFRGMTDALGVNGDVMLEKMQQVSAGLADSSAIMLSTARGLQQGLSESQLVRLLDLARERARLAGTDVATAFNAMSDAIASNSTKALRQFNIVLDNDKALKDYARTVGTYPEALTQAEKIQAIFNATMEAAAKQTKAATTALDEHLDRLERNKQRTADFWTGIWSAIVDAHGELLGFVEDFDKAAERFGRRKIGELGVGLAPGASEGLPGGIGTSDRSRTGGSPRVAPELPPAPEIDKVARALASADHAMRLLNAQQAAGVITSSQYEAGLTAQLGSLQALGTKLDEDGRLKVLALQAALNQVRLPEWMATMKKLVDDTSEALGEAGLLLEIKDVDAELEKLSLKLGENAEAVKRDADAWREEQAAMELAAAAMARIAPLAESIQATFSAGGDSFSSELVAMNRELRAMEAASDLDAESIRKFGVSFRLLDEQTQTSLLSFREWRTTVSNTTGERAYSESLAVINAQSALLGDRFDAVGSTISLMESRLRQMAETSKGVVTPAMVDLAQQLDKLVEFKETKDMFADMFGSVQGGISKMIEGLQLGTRSWKDFGSMALDVLRSVAAEIVNRLLKKALDPLVDKLATVAAAALGGTGRGASVGVGTGVAPAGSAVNVDPETGTMLGADALNNIPTSVLSPSFLQTVGAAFTSAYQVFQLGEGLGNAASSFIATFGEAYQAMSGFSTALGYAAAAVQGLFTILDENKTDLGKAIQTATLAAGVALAGPTFGISLIVAPLINWLEDLFGVFGKGPSEYELKRIQAADEANSALGRLGSGFQDALTSGDIAKVLAALQAGGGGAAGNSVRTELVLPASLAQSIGLAGQQIGDQIVTQWSDVTLEQFQKVLAAMKENPALIDAIRGSGDVPYLEGGDAAAIAEKIKEGAQSLLKAFVEMEKVRDRITEIGAELAKAADKILPPDLAAKFTDGIVNPIRDRMLAVLDSGLAPEEMQKQLDALASELAAWGGLVALYASVQQDIAQLSGDIASQTQGAILGIETMLDAANKAVQDARSRFAESITPEEQLAAASQLREAILSRYKTEVDLVNQIQSTIANLLQNVGGPAAANAAWAGAELLRQGDATAFNEIYLALVNMAREAPTAAQQLFAIAQGIGTVLAALTTSASFFANGFDIYGTNGPRPANGQPGGPATVPDLIVSQLATNVAPFFAELGEMIQAAAAAGDLQGQIGLLQQQAELIKSVGAAAVKAVQDWAVEAKRLAAQQADEMRKDINKNWDAVDKAIADTADGAMKSIEAARDLRVSGLEDEIARIEDAAKARQKEIAAEVDTLNTRQKAIQAEQAALQQQLESAREWEGVAKSAGDFLQQLRLSNDAPLNPADQLGLAQSAFAAAQNAFNASPTAAAAAEVQKAAEDLLGAGKNVFTRSSPEYQALFDSVVSAMENVQAVAGEQVPVSSADLEAQTQALSDESQKIADRIASLNDESKRIGDAASEQVQGLRDLIDQAKSDAEKDLDFWKQWKKDEEERAEAGRKADLDAVDAWLKAQTEAIDKVAQDTIDGINKGTAQALLENARQQSLIQERLIDSQVAQLKAVIDPDNTGRTVQTFMAEKARDTVKQLEDLNLKIAHLIELLPVHAAGTTFARGGLAIVDPGEIIIPPTPSEAIRRGAMLFTARPGIPTREAGASTVALTYAPSYHVAGGIDDATEARLRRISAEDRRKLERELVHGSLGEQIRRRPS